MAKVFPPQPSLKFYDAASCRWMLYVYPASAHAKWKIWINGHGETMDTIPPFHAQVEFNGWPAGLMNPNGGEIAAGLLANVFTLRDALKARAAR